MTMAGIWTPAWPGPLAYFEKDTTYCLVFRIFPKTGYQISDVNDVPITVNGDSQNLSRPIITGYINVRS